MNKFATRTTGIFAAMTAVLIMAFAMVVSAQSDTPDWRLPVTGLTVSAGDDPGEMVINVGCSYPNYENITKLPCCLDTTR